MSRTSSNRGRGRGPQEFEPDGWAVAGAPRPQPKAGDLSKFGQIQKPAAMSFGPASVFSKGKDSKREQPISRSSSSSNMFSMLQQAESAAETKASGMFSDAKLRCKSHIFTSQSHHNGGSSFSSLVQFPRRRATAHLLRLVRRMAAIRRRHPTPLAQK